MELAPLEQTSVFTVSQLTAQIKKLLETNFRFIWVSGEISNLRIPASGHAYFTLKDEHSQIRAVMFRAQQRGLRFVPEDGQQVLCQGRITVFEPRGEYQLIVDVMEPRGVGLLQLAFEQLKKRLESEGLFDPARKRPLPSCPQRIGIATSATGAAIRDMLKVLQRSPYPLTITLLPVRVQGQGAAPEIAAAIATFNDLADTYGWDVVIVGRGGGSLEDLWPFNEEIVARAIARSQLPIISAVGHEIDVTIADLVADLRAPTPTAAAEWIVAQLEKLQTALSQQQERMLGVLKLRTESYRQVLHFFNRRLVDPRKRLVDLRLTLDDRLTRLSLAWGRRLEQLQTVCKHLLQRLSFSNPMSKITQQREQIARRHKELLLHQRALLDLHRTRLQGCVLRLQTLSPLAVLARGYSITYLMPEEKIVRDQAQVAIDQHVRVQLAKGSLECQVKDKKPESGASLEE
jgi:exodeoxyribonuclease VII large subunit